MRYSIIHTTTYHYDRPVQLQPHMLRLRPRSDGWHQLESFDVQVSPLPIGRSELTDFDGNAGLKVWFADVETDRLEIVTTSVVTTTQTNPFGYLLDAYALQLPIDYPSSVKAQLQSYLRSTEMIDPVAVELAQDLWVQTDGDTSIFLSVLNQLINTNCGYGMRETGRPLPPGVTWRDRQGSCRDFSVLFMEVCRAAGLAARFVSGYQEGDLKKADHYLHAWVEVYLPGAGWRGYDPTLGLLVSDRHIAICSSVDPSYTVPVVGEYRPGLVRSRMEYGLKIVALE